MGLFTDDTSVLAVGEAYLRRVGLAYPFLGLGLSLYFAAQGRGRVVQPLLASLTRLLVAGAGGYAAVTLLGCDLHDLFILMAVGLVSVRPRDGRGDASGTPAGYRSDGTMRILVVRVGPVVNGYFGERLLEAARDVRFLVRPEQAARLAETGLVTGASLTGVAIAAGPKTNARL